MKFYIAKGETRKKLLELDVKRREIGKQRQKFVKRFKAKGSVTRGGYLVGLVFNPEKCHPEEWVVSKRLCKDVANSYTPNNSKAGKALKEEMRNLQDPVDHWSISSIVSVNSWKPGYFTLASIAIICKKVVIGLDDDCKNPKECVRISDLQYENLLKRHKSD